MTGTGAAGWLIVASGLVAALAVADTAAAVAAGAAFGLLGLGLARAWLRQRRECRARWQAEAADEWAGMLGGLSQWTEQDEAVLSGDLSMAAWEQAGQVRRGGAG